MNHARAEIVLVFILMFYLSAATAGVKNNKNWVFKVYLDQKEIGYHKVQLDQTNGDTNIEVEANFDVKFLFITAYTYRHKTHEVWRDGCLVEIDSKTDDNGKPLFLKTLDSGEGFYLETHDGVQILPGCVRSFAYWNHALLSAERLLNTQTGVYETVELQMLGISSFILGEEKIEGSHYRLVLGTGEVDLWYSSDAMDWLALRSTVDGGRKIYYIRSEQVL